MREGDIADADLDEAKAYVIGGLPRRLETNEGLALHLLERERFGLGPHADDEFVARLRAITPREVAALARSLLADNRMASVMAGPQGEGQGR